MSEAQNYRNYVKNRIVQPARRRGESEVRVSAKHIADNTTRLSGNYPNIWQSITGRKFKRQAGVADVLTNTSGPSSTTIFTIML